MGIEQWHLNHTPENPAYLCLMRLNEWREGLDLSPQTVKVINNLREVPHYTALGARMGINPDSSRLTPQERELIEGEIQKVPVLLLVDVDGVLVSIWPALVDFWKKWKESPTLSPSQIWKKLEESIAQARPPWRETLLPLARMAKAANQVIIWTNRVPVNQESRFWKKALRIIFDDGTWLERFPFFSKQAAERLEKAMPFVEKTQVLVGFPKNISPILQKIEEMGDPYVIYVGSSWPDIRNFKRIIEELRRREDPFDRIVFCSTNHLIL